MLKLYFVSVFVINKFIKITAPVQMNISYFKSTTLSNQQFHFRIVSRMSQCNPECRQKRII